MGSAPSLAWVAVAVAVQALYALTSSPFPRASAKRRSVVVATTLGTCVVCQQEAPTSVAWRHVCSSTCCVKCLQFYVALKVSQGLVQPSQLTCPDPRCLTPLDHTEVQAYTSDDIFALYRRTLRQEEPQPGKAKSHFFQRKKAQSSTSSAASSCMALPRSKRSCPRCHAPLETATTKYLHCERCTIDYCIDCLHDWTPRHRCWRKWARRLGLRSAKDT
ncbi:hypothetical protein SDRG_13865 [Saprolegnia diclina VS20]|uniref:RBR-type E3 ubiquitin transferase n=1 Tax=Saprolegnia diclina (strain VS20) TaxID=1156394 RepID=T0RF65_SAPDV|nr:hypothetical protein SDRG_13865 [Saprolegnia diclina VS20]EQC28317.1 hypothetical protein SDRG_13865 [Saprolegnia diclina VS20]|eukprot:XP_008618187.1 hypothetical protein SDRG_13865 [Saprolegnia diclina VS20]